MKADALLDTAIDQFGRLGFDGASTRGIAAASGTAMSTITYHFGGKEGLYLAAAERIAAAIAEVQGPLLENVAARFAAAPEDAPELLARLLGGFARIMVMPASAPWARFISREQQEPSAAFERLYRGVMAQTKDLVLRLIAAARPDLAPLEVRATAIQLIGQALVLRSGRASACRILEVETLDGEILEILIARLAANVRAILARADA